MKKESWVDQLSHATKATIAICGVLLLLSAVISMLLMIFPIRKVDNPTVVTEPQRHTEYSTTTATTTAPISTTKPYPQTLSTWNAGVSGYSRSADEFIETEEWEATTDPRLYREPTEQKTTEAPEYSSPEATTLDTLSEYEYDDDPPSVETRTETVIIIPDDPDFDINPPTLPPEYFQDYE